MIPAKYKFPLRTEFLAFRRRARRLHFPQYTPYFLPTSRPSRLSVIIPKKVNKLATARNWLKRLTYDTLWPLIKDKNLDLVIVYKPLLLSKSSATKEKIISELSSLEFK